MKYIVYQTTNLINGKIYIGQHKTKDPNVFDQYIGCGIKINMPSSYENPSSPLQYAVKKYGVKNFKRTIIKVFDTLEEALALEAELVDYEFLKRSDTYNAQLGGKTGYKYLPINQFDLQGNFIKTWNNMMDAADFYCVSHTAIYNAVNFKGSCKHFYWSKDKQINIKDFTDQPETKCFQYSADTGKFVAFYNSIKEAAYIIGVTPQSIGNAIQTGYNIKGYYFSYKMLEEYNGKPKISLKNKILYVYNLSGDFITELSNGKEIKNFFEIKTTNQITVALRKGTNYKNYQFSLEKVEKMNPLKIKTHYKRAVLVYDINSNFIEELPTIDSAVKKYSRGVQKVLKGVQQQCKGYIFKYKE